MSDEKPVPIGTFEKAAPWGLVHSPYYAEFDHFGAKFCVHDCESDEWSFHAAHIGTGFAVPRSGAPTVELAAKRAIATLDEYGEEKFKEAVVKAESRRPS